MNVKILGETKLKLEVWDYLLNRLQKVENKHYDNLVLEIGISTTKNRRSMIGFERTLTVNVGGLGGDYVELEMRTGTSKTNLTLFEFKGMARHDWKPIHNSTKEIVLFWVRPPFIYCCIDLSGLGLNKIVKEIIEALVKQIEKLKGYNLKLDLKNAEIELRKLIKRGSEKELRNAKERLKKLSGEYERLQSGMATIYSSMINARKLVSGISRIGKSEIDIEQMLKRITKINGVKGIMVEDSKIVVITNPLKAKYKNMRDKSVTIPIGSYRITWGMGTGINITNLEKNPSYQFDHPHVEGGVACWGNMGEIGEYAQEFKIDVAIEMVLAYLQAINPDSAHRRPEKWKKEWRKR